MYKQLKKMPGYLLKLFQKGSPKEFYQIINNVRFEHVLIALAARVDRKDTAVGLRNMPGYYEINNFLELLSYRKTRVEDDIYLWDFGQKQIYCNYMQLTGLQGEYLQEEFEEIYKYDWKGKTVVDIGGFVGDTALYFLSKGAKKIVIYEPVEKNIKALNYNLKGHEKSIECHRKALADKDGPFTLYSDQPECSSSFGLSNGKFQIACSGITMTSLLNQHQPIDVIKVDCEGGEVHLLGMTNGEIRSVPYWIIETHSKELYHNTIRKFADHGFIKTYEKGMNAEVDVLHFKIDRVNKQ